MSSEILTPVLPESVADATVVAWSKKVGDASSRTKFWLKSKPTKWYWKYLLLLMVS